MRSATFCVDMDSGLSAAFCATGVEAVKAGAGIGALHDYLAIGPCREGSLVRVLPAWSLPMKRIHAVFPSRRGQLPAVRALLDMLAAEFASSSHASPAH